MCTTLQCVLTAAFQITHIPEILAGIIFGGLCENRRKSKLADFNLAVLTFRYVMLLRENKNWWILIWRSAHKPPN